MGGRRRLVAWRVALALRVTVAATFVVAVALLGACASTADSGEAETAESGDTEAEGLALRAAGLRQEAASKMQIAQEYRAQAATTPDYTASSSYRAQAQRLESEAARLRAEASELESRAARERTREQRDAAAPQQP